MACFIVPATEAVVTTIVEKVVKTREEKNETLSQGKPEAGVKIPLSKKLGWLNKMLWGGSALLAFEHVWHGEITPFFPFLTAMGNTNDVIAMLNEMSTVGVAMALSVTAVWSAMVFVSNKLVKRDEKFDEAIEVKEEK